MVVLTVSHGWEWNRIQMNSDMAEFGGSHSAKKQFKVVSASTKQCTMKNAFCWHLQQCPLQVRQFGTLLKLACCRVHISHKVVSLHVQDIRILNLGLDLNVILRCHDSIHCPISLLTSDTSLKGSIARKRQLGHQKLWASPWYFLRFQIWQVTKTAMDGIV